MSRILVIKLSSLGDLFHALPAVHLIKQATGATIDWVTQPEYVELVKCFTDVDRVIAFPRSSFVAGFPEFESALKQETYDLVLDMQGLLKSAFVGRLARAKRRVGPSFSREGARLFYDAVSGPTNKERHAVEENLDMVRHLGHPAGSVKFPFRPPVSTLAAPWPRIGVVACSRWTTKNWPAAHFAEVCKSLLGRKGGIVYLFGSAGDAAVCSEIEGRVAGNVVNLCGQTSLVETASAMRDLSLVITVDSGPMHMAAALGIPVLAVFGATDPKRTGPFGAAHRVVTLGGLPCQPCFSRTCIRPERDTKCLVDLRP
ncbi:MAG TPA: glycosyltransferase family 9 protein, partial [Kiritimatiellia bacterium]